MTIRKGSSVSPDVKDFVLVLFQHDEDSSYVTYSILTDTPRRQFMLIPVKGHEVGKLPSNFTYYYRC